MRKLHIIIDVLIAIVVIVIIISLVSGRDSLYYQDAQKVYSKAEKAAASLDLSKPENIYKLSNLYREVFDKYPDSRWADDAVYRLASRIDPTEEEAIILYRRLIRDYPDSEYIDKALYTIAMGYYDRGQYDKAIIEFGEVISKYQASELAEKSYFNAAL